MTRPADTSPAGRRLLLDLAGCVTDCPRFVRDHRQWWTLRPAEIQVAQALARRGLVELDGGRPICARPTAAGWAGVAALRGEREVAP